MLLSLAVPLFLALHLPRTTAAPSEPSVHFREQVSGPDFSREVRPILARRCFACHGPDEDHRAAGLRLDLRSAALEERPDGAAIVVGDADASLLFHRVQAHGDLRMPPPEAGRGLEPAEIAVLEAWIESGAPYARHWAFELPQANTALQASDEIDRLVDARLEEVNLQRREQADRRTLLRRLSLDLIGLPPTPEELSTYLSDESEGAYSSQVERLLASPHFGERWARVWLDLARYADSSGYGSDPLRKIWRFRDWVIEAYNDNLPYDEFTRLQLAGDLLPEPSTDDVLATAFHRNTMTNTEGGTDDEEFRVAAVKDRVNTTFQVWMGLTAGCAQCHNHKFDPISQREYYQLFDFFNHTEDSDRNDDRPRLATPTREQAQRLATIDSELADLAMELESWLDSPQGRAAQMEWEAGLAAAWQPATLESPSGEVLGLAQGQVAGKLEGSVSRLRLSAPDSLVGLRLMARSEPDLPSGGPGRAGGNFVLNEIRLTIPAAQRAVYASRVRVELEGTRRILSLAEVEVFSEGHNIAVGAAARQSSTSHGGAAELAVDGRTEGLYDKGSVTHSATEDDPWWEVDWKREAKIDAVVLYNRTDRNLGERLNGARITFFSERGDVVASTYALHPGDVWSHAPGFDDVALRLSDPRASFEQKHFPLRAAIDGSEGPRSGWAIAPRVGRDHHADFRVKVPPGMLASADSQLELELVQSYDENHKIGHLEVAFTDNPRALGLDPALVTGLADRTAEQERGLRMAFAEAAPEWAEWRKRRDAKRAERDAIDVPTTPIMRQLPPEKQRSTHLLVKGNFLTPGEAVEAAVPAALHAWPAQAPVDRLGLALWLVSEENPLTARVAVNRVWSQLFGRGLVETEEDFGSQGSLPTHPELLDYLACSYMDSGWDHKQLLRTIVHSETYRQDSASDARRRELDPGNRLFSRGPRVRLEAEALRDQALAVAGLLSARIGGPSVYPPQPPGLWQAAFNGQRNWPTSEGEDRWRRGLYVFLRRTIPYPSLATFDAPSRELCTSRRIRTNTPLQALVLLNDPVYVETAQALARRMWNEGGDRVRDRLAFAWELCTSHPGAEEDLAELEVLWRDIRAELRGDPQRARTLACDPLGELPDWSDEDILDLAALRVVAGVLLNLDAVVVKS